VVDGVEGAKPAEVQLDSLEVGLIQVREGGSRVDKSDCLSLSLPHLVIVHGDSTERHLEIVIAMHEVQPVDIAIVVPLHVDKMTRLIIATDLEVATVLTETHREDALFDDVLLFHHIVNRFKSINIHAWALSAEAQNSIGILRVEILGLSLNTAKSVLE